MKFKTTILIFFLLLTFLSCDDNSESPIPSYTVRLRIDLGVGKYVTFRNSTNEFLLFEKPIVEGDRIGFGGVFVYSAINFDDGGNTIYYAYDLACPYEVKSNIKIHPIKDDWGKLKCSECGSVYDVSNGWGVPDGNGPSDKILRQYKTTLSGNVLTVYN